MVNPPSPSLSFPFQLLLPKLRLAFFLLDFTPELLGELMTNLTNAGFAPYIAGVGGAGVGFLHPRQTSEGEDLDLKGLLVGQGVDGLDGWALGVGRWSFA